MVEELGELVAAPGAQSAGEGGQAEHPKAKSAIDDELLEHSVITTTLLFNIRYTGSGLVFLFVISVTLFYQVAFGPQKHVKASVPAKHAKCIVSLNKLRCHALL